MKSEKKPKKIGSLKARKLSRHKDNLIKQQIKKMLLYLKENIATASMVSKATGIPQKNICRYKRRLEKLNKLVEVKHEICKVTGHKAWYLSTNPDLLSKNITPKPLVNE